MMKKNCLRKGSFLVMFLMSMFAFVGTAKADSPLTSTEFHVVYKDLPQFTDTISTYEYLLDDSVAVEKRLAVINRMGWNIDGQQRTAELLALLAGAMEVEDINEVFKSLSGYQLICIAYLQALDDYFNVEYAMLLAAMAEAKEPNSYSVNLIAALIRAQYAMDNDWGAVYLGMDHVRKCKHLNIDMCPEASAAIFEYTDMYKEDVK